MAPAAGEPPMKRLMLMTAAAVAACLVSVTAGQQPAPSSYTAEQATAGRAVYQANCASCHLPDLAGRNEAPPLVGVNFMNTWRSRSTRDLFEFIQATMPPNGATLSAEDYLAVTTFILQSNGAPAGTQAFTPTTAAPIGSVATGAAQNLRAPQTTSADDPAPTGGGRGGRQGAAAGGQGAGGRGAQGGAAGGRGGPAVSNVLGVTVAGEVKNYVPVTDEMLRSQDPGDWLMARRNYSGWSHSPLTQITRDNARELQLVWVSPMNEGQGNEPSPVVHNGVIYLNNTTNIVQ